MEPVEIVDVSLPVNQFVSWVSIDIEIMFNCFLLAFGQIVVNAVLTSQIVLLDCVLPRFLRTVVGQVEINDVVVHKSLFQLVRLLQCSFAGAAPRSPDVEIDYTALVRLEIGRAHV